MIKLNEFMKLVSWIVVFQVIGFLLGKVTQGNLYPWYSELSKSTLTPPGFVFGIVWSILYILLAVVGWALWKNRSNSTIKKSLYLYFIQLLMNWAWTPLFFQLHWLGFSFLWITIMIILNGMIIVKLKSQKNQLAYALTPYLAWLLFASYLNFIAWIMN